MYVFWCFDETSFIEYSILCLGSSDLLNFVGKLWGTNTRINKYQTPQKVKILQKWVKLEKTRGSTICITVKRRQYCLYTHKAGIYAVVFRLWEYFTRRRGLPVLSLDSVNVSSAPPFMYYIATLCQYFLEGRNSLITWFSLRYVRQVYCIMYLFKSSFLSLPLLSVFIKCKEMISFKKGRMLKWHLHKIKYIS